MAVLAMVLAGTATAQVLGVHLVSQHAPAYQYNNVNPGIYWQSVELQKENRNLQARIDMLEAANASLRERYALPMAANGGDFVRGVA